LLGDFFREVLRFVVFKLIVPVVKPIMLYGIKPIYKLFFGKLDERASKNHDEQLAQDLRKNIPWLFDKQKATIIPSTKVSHGFDYAMVTIAVGNLLICFTRCRGEIRAQLASVYSPAHWEELDGAISLVAKTRAPEFFRLATLGAVLEQHFDQLNAAYAPPDTPQQI
jgi:hypothetical protein